jgi:hypothetical protein
VVLAGVALAGTVVAGIATHPFGKKEKQPGPVAMQVAPVPVKGGGVLVIGGSF